jgi:GT2 family glycosyltransferase
MNGDPVASIVVVSFNTRDLLRECLQTVERNAGGVACEVIVVDNASRDGSADMVAAEFPGTRLIRSSVNLGFAGANNAAFPHVRGRYTVLLNSDAFLEPDALPRAIKHMEEETDVGLGGARLIGRDGSWQPSARMFPSLVNDLLILSGMSAKYPDSPLFGRADRTWADQNQVADVDWVPGAFSIIRTDLLSTIGYFDENFFLYYEEVDLCKRIKAAGFKVRYWPDVVVVHLGGESSKTLKTLSMSSSGAQLTLWRMRSALLYYRKHHGGQAWLARQLETAWHSIRRLKNRRSTDQRQLSKAEESDVVMKLMEQAWQDTKGGRVSPARPW